MAKSARSRPPEERRAQLLAAARKLFAKRGFEGTAVSEIVAKAKVSQGTFYLYFRSKEDVLTALAGELSAAMGAEARRVTSGAENLEETIDALVEAAPAVHAEHADILVVANRAIDLSETFDDWARLTQPYREAIVDALAPYQRSGDLPADLDLESVSFVIRDILDRTGKAAVLYDRDDYAGAARFLLRRALVAPVPSTP